MRVAKVTQQAEGTRRIRMTWPMSVVRRQCVPRVAAVVALAAWYCGWEMWAVMMAWNERGLFRSMALEFTIGNTLPFTIGVLVAVTAACALLEFRPFIGTGVSRGEYLRSTMLTNAAMAGVAALLLTVLEWGTRPGTPWVMHLNISDEASGLAHSPYSVFGPIRYYMGYATLRRESNYAVLWLTTALTLLAAVMIGQCLGELVAHFNALSWVAVGVMAVWAVLFAADTLNLLRGTALAQALRWLEQAVQGNVWVWHRVKPYGYNQAFSIWPQLAFVAAVWLIGGGLCTLLVRRREIPRLQILPVLW